MAAPSFVQASTGSQDASGTFTATGTATGTIGDVVLLQIVNDGSGAISWGTLTNSNINDLAGSAGWTEIGIFNAGAAVQQRLFIGRRTSASSAPTFTASANTSGDDVYWRFYEFTNVSAGTTLATVIENATAWDGFSTASVSGGNIWGATGTNEMAAQSFTSPGAASTLTQIGVRLVKNTSPADNIIIELQTDSSGSPSGSVVSTIATVAASSISAAGANYLYPCSISLSASTTYWIVIRRDGARDTGNYVIWASTPVAYSGGVGKTRGSGTWSGDAADFDFLLSYSADQGQISIGATDTVCRDAAVTTLGPDRLALNFVGLADDAMGLAAFAGETGGDWTLPVAIFETSTGTDATVALMAAYTGVANFMGLTTTNIVEIQGSTGTNEVAGQSFVPDVSGTITSVTFYPFKNGSPTDDVIVEVQADNAGAPSGSRVGSSGSVAATAITSEVPVQVSLSASVTSGTTYWLVFTRSGVRSTSNYIGCYRSAASTYAGGTANQRNSGVWTAEAGDCYFIASMATTIDGGSDAITSIAWNTVGFALIGTTVILDQQHYRFRNDDGNETTATWLADLDTDVN